MATNDWKSELKRRIKDIRDRKEEEEKVESRTKKYKKPSAEPRTVPFPKQPESEKAIEIEEAVAEPIAEETEPNDPIVEKTVEEKTVEPVTIEKPKPAEAVDATPETTGPDDTFDPDELLEEVEEEVAASEPKSVETEEAIFQVDEGGEEASAVNHDEEAIRAQLARISGSPKKAKAKPQEPTLFPVEEQKAPVEDKRVRMDAAPITKAPEVPIVEDPKAAPPPVIERPKAKEKRKEETPSAPMASNPESLDEAIDQYIPADSVAEETKPEKEVVAKKPAATIVDKTVRHMCIKRIGAAVFDITLMLGVVAAVAWISSMIVQSGPLSLLLGSLVPFASFGVALHFLYYVIFTATTGQTLGKAVFSLRAVRKEPGNIGLGQAALRWLIGLAGTAFALLGYLTMFLTPDGAAVQDIALQQRVRRTKKN